MRLSFSRGFPFALFAIAAGVTAACAAPTDASVEEPTHSTAPASSAAPAFVDSNTPIIANPAPTAALEPRFAPFANPPAATEPAPSSSHGRHKVADEADCTLCGVPPEWGQMISLGSDIAGEISGVKAGIDMATKVLQLAGFLGQPVDPVQQKLDAINKKLDEVYAAVQDGNMLQRRLHVADQIGQSRNARNGVIAWFHAHPNGDVLPPRGPEDTQSGTAVTTLMVPDYWQRPWDDRIYQPHWATYIKDRPARDAYGMVWDYRIVLPSLIDAITNRLEVLAAMRPGYARDAYYSYELLPIRDYLVRVHDQMEQGIRCGKSYEFQPGDGTVDEWVLYDACVDIYTGASVEGGSSWWDKDQPSNAWAMQRGDSDNSYNRLALRDKLGLPALEQIVDKVSWYSFVWRPLYANRDAMLASSGNMGGTGLDTHSDEQLWSYDPFLRRLKNGTGHCPKGYPVDTLMGAPTECNWTDPNQRWLIDGAPSHLHNDAGLCVSVENGSFVGRACDSRPTENIAWKRLVPNSAFLANKTLDRMDTVTTDFFGAIRHSTWNPQVNGYWQTAEFLPSASVPPMAPVAVIARTPYHLDAFVADKTGAVLSTWRDQFADNDTWHPWFQVMPSGSVPPGANVVAMSREPGSVDVFAVGNDGSVLTNWWNGAVSPNWHTAFSITPKGLAKPGGGLSVTSRDALLIDVFVATNDGAVATAWWNGYPNGNGWSFGSNFRVMRPGTLPAGAQIAASSRVRDHIDVFAVDVNGAIETAWFDSDNRGWNAQFPVSPQHTAVPGGGVSTDSTWEGHVDVFAIGQNGAIWSNWWDQNFNNANWNQAFMISNPNYVSSGSVLASTARYNTHNDVFVVDGSALRSTFWDPNVNTPSHWAGTFDIPQLITRIRWH